MIIQINEEARIKRLNQIIERIEKEAVYISDKGYRDFSIKKLTDEMNGIKEEELNTAIQKHFEGSVRLKNLSTNYYYFEIC